MNRWGARCPGSPEYGNPDGVRISKANDIQNNPTKQLNIRSTPLTRSTKEETYTGLRASYNISLLIAKSGKPHTIGEKLILPAVEEVLKTVLHKPASDIIKRIPLSNNTVERRNG
ncbi:unnamed protein product [Acanthoscelides obtectus]|uniref:Uncharacterized protein n=1 Tax=Acanthoscelides obtectus TaxID=200917 RepID=A0A9P0LSV0_ACAOB|nr:unnamed protein product [Acanthoscelides obtectus]CAK1670318.1 SCAN domain-containing protein 3 [Acanthoscelides obtectus]